MRLYPRDAHRTVIDHPAWGRFEAGEHGGFDLPDDLSDELHSFHHRGKRVWETEDERSVREGTEDLGRRRDPAALFDTVSGMADLTRQLAEVQLAQSAPAPAVPASREDEIAALKARLAELEDSTESAEDPAVTGEKPAPRTPARTPAKDKPAAAKTAAAS